MYSDISAYITQLRCDHSERIVPISVEQQPDDGYAIRHDCILLPFVQEPHLDHFHHQSDHESRNTDANCDNAYVDAEQPPVQTHIYGAPYMDNDLTGNKNSNQDFDIFDDEIDLWSPLTCKEEYQLVRKCIKHNLSRAAINKHFRYPTMATFSNLT